MLRSIAGQILPWQIVVWWPIDRLHDDTSGRALRDYHQASALDDYTEWEVCLGCPQFIAATSGRWLSPFRQDIWEKMVKLRSHKHNAWKGIVSNSNIRYVDVSEMTEIGFLFVLAAFPLLQIMWCCTLFVLCVIERAYYFLSDRIIITSWSWLLIMAVS